MAATAAKKKKYTYQDYLKTPDDVRYELIEGDMLMTPSPTPTHQRISRKIEFILEKHVTKNDLGEVFYAPCDVYLDNENLVQPDILVISKERLNIIGEKNIQGAPDLVIEIISESTAYRDLVQKKKLYAMFGVKEYWIVIPDEGSVEILILRDKSYISHKIYTKEDTLESPLMKGLCIELKNIF
jgi:Uma2 family endonuclease